jgi:DNA mismatch repair protein MutS
LGCKTLFATHYHELTAIAEQLPRVSNFSVSIVEQDGKIIFLHRIIPGGADKSYGVHVAQLAGLPRSVTSRAWHILSDLENVDKFDGIESSLDNKPTQISLFRKESQLLKNITQLDIPNMTPLEAMNKLYELQQKAKDEEI